MSNPITLETIYDEIAALRVVVASIPEAIAARLAKLSARPPYKEEGKAGAARGDDEISVPQPTTLVAEPGAAEVHFGKNKGRRIDDLSASSLSWYVAKWEPREKNSGGLWPNDEALLNAARQFWHSRQKTLQGSTPANAPAPDRSTPPPAENLDEDVPF